MTVTLMAVGTCLVECHALHLTGKSAYSSCDGETITFLITEEDANL